MATYLVCLKGTNFLLEDDQGPRKKRLRSTRLVEAENKKRAEALARALLGSDPRLRKTILNEASDPPVILLESITEVSAVAYDAQKRAAAFFWENEDNE